KVVTSRWPDPATSKVDLGFPQTRQRTGRGANGELDPDRASVPLQHRPLPVARRRRCRLRRDRELGPCDRGETPPRARVAALLSEHRRATVTKTRAFRNGAWPPPSAGHAGFRRLGPGPDTRISRTRHGAGGGSAAGG